MTERLITIPGPLPRVRPDTGKSEGKFTFADTVRAVLSDPDVLASVDDVIGLAELRSALSVAAGSVARVDDALWTKLAPAFKRGAGINPAFRLDAAPHLRAFVDARLAPAALEPGAKRGGKRR